MDEYFWSINRDRKLYLCRSRCHQNVVLQTTAKKLKFKLIIPELVVLILQAKPLEKKKNQKSQVTFFGFVLFKVGFKVGNVGKVGKVGFKVGNAVV